MMSAPAAPAGNALVRMTALSTRVDLVVTDPSAVVAASSLLREELERIDRVASRFRADSEVSALQDAASHGEPATVSPDLLEAVTVGLRAASLTDGLVDPTVGVAMCRLGYDRDFDQVGNGVPGDLPAPAAVTGWQTVTVDLERSTVTMPPGTILDLGATAKALAADRAASSIAARVGCGTMVSLGGDVAVAGAPNGGFAVGIADVCGDGSSRVTVAIGSGGLATSGIGARQWSLGGRPVHHLLDPRTGLPADPYWRTVSVAAGTCVDANTASTAAMIMGAGALHWLEDRGLPARLVHADGTVVTVAGWPPDASPAHPAVLVSSR